MDLRMIPRTYLSIVLTAVRRPVDMAEKLVWPEYEHRPWPPRLVYDGFEANVKALAGRALGDEVLLEAGRRQEARVAQLRQAEDFEAFAQQTREQAGDEFEARRQMNERRIEDAAQREEEQKKEADKQAAEREKAAKKKAAAESRSEQKVEEAVDKALEREERHARLQAISKERRAVAEKRAAVATEERADEVEGQIERSKAARRTGK